MSTDLKKKLLKCLNKWLREYSCTVTFIVSGMLSDKLLKACENDFL